MSQKNNNSRPTQPQGPRPGGPGRGPRNVFVEKPKDLKGTIKKLFVYIKYKKGLFYTKVR